MMLDAFEVLTTSGVVLWSRTFTPVNPAVINNFIVDVFIEEKTGTSTVGTGARDARASAAQNAPYRTDHQTLRWAFVKELGVIFVAVYNSLLNLSWIDRLVDNLATIFVDLYGDQLRRPHSTIVRTKRFGEYFDQQLAQLEREAGSSGSAGFSRASAGPGGMASSELPGVPSAATSPAALRHRERPSLSGNFGDEPDDYEDDDGPPPMPGLATFRGGKPPQQQQKGAEVTPGGSPATSRPGTPAGAAAGAKMSRRARKAQQQAYGGAPMSSGDESSSAAVAAAARRKGASTKKGRKWDADGMAVEDDGDIVLDYSTVASDAGGVDGSGMAVRATGVEHVDESTWGRRAQGGKFVLNDLDDEVASILARGEEARKQKEAERASKGVLASVASGGGLVGSGVSAISGLFRNVVGGKTLTKEDLEKAMKGMEEHLLRKNVAREAAVRLCEGVEQELLGVRTGSFESISTRVRAAMEASLTKMLTPTSSLDLLREIDAIAKPPPTSLRKPRPYVMSIVGVNGVGKSTNLSKICFFLLQNGYRVLVAAADTFRSGAVEQLATHVRNLSELAAREASGRAHVELYQRGYGKDAATVAKDAVAFAAAEAFDVVLIDTAGRRHNDQRLMSSLEKFAKLAQPDKILMVGEALVGSDAVAQARNFNAAFGAGRRLDGFIMSKCDTVGDMVGTLVSIVHATHVPVLFVGVGQHYQDLRSFSVRWAVEKLLASP